MPLGISKSTCCDPAGIFLWIDKLLRLNHFQFSITAAPELLTLSAEALAKEELGRESKEPQRELKLPRFKDFVESAQAKNYIELTTQLIIETQ